MDAERIKKKLKLASDLFKFAITVKKFQLRQKYPDLSEVELNHKAYALIEKGCR